MIVMQVVAKALRPGWGGGASDEDKEVEDGEGLLINQQVGGDGALPGLSTSLLSEGVAEGQWWKGH